nr:host cell division inhibitor Icd-like protein [Escherichia coli]
MTMEAHSEQEERLLATEGFVMVFVARIRNQLKWGVK